jgi:hypothetical protein
MINKDYILRLAERIGRELSIFLRLRQRDNHEETLIYIDDQLLNTTGMTSSFINSLSEEMLLRALTPLGAAHVDLSRWLIVAAWLKIEGDVYEEMGKNGESYYRYLKSLFLFLETLKREPIDEQPLFATEIQELLTKLSDYELPITLKSRLFWYYEYKGQYAKAEDILCEIQEIAPDDQEFNALGKTFYQRLQMKSEIDLHAGNFSHEEVLEGLEKLQRYGA